MSLHAEYALAQLRAAQRGAPDLPLPGTDDWHTAADVRAAYRAAQRAPAPRGSWRTALRERLTLRRRSRVRPR